MSAGGTIRAGDVVTKDGFRLRGLKMTRVETFTDAAFAFAVTLLVISIDYVPGSYAEMVEALKGLPAFAGSFALIMLFWHAHWSWSQRYGLDDGPTVLLSGALVFTVLGYVYPLRYLSELFVHAFSGGRLSPGARIESLDQLYGLFAIYGVGFVTMCGLVVALHAHAWQRRGALELDQLERLHTRMAMGAWSVVGGVGVVSLLLAVATPPSGLVLPGWVYMILPVLMPVLGLRWDRKAKELLRERAAEAPGRDGTP